MQNLELFACLYARSWSNPAACTSARSRLLGFLTALPGIIRALQCLRRYHDTRNTFPHLANGGKYLCTILYSMTLSLYRIDSSQSFRALFFFCATINSIYCGKYFLQARDGTVKLTCLFTLVIWDIAMDWSRS